MRFQPLGFNVYRYSPGGAHTAVRTSSSGGHVRQALGCAWSYTFFNRSILVCVYTCVVLSDA